MTGVSLFPNAYTNLAKKPEVTVPVPDGAREVQGFPAEEPEVETSTTVSAPPTGQEVTHLLSARGTFHLHRIVPASDVEGIDPQGRFYELKELDEMFEYYRGLLEDLEYPLVYRLYLIQGFARKHGSLYAAQNLFGRKKVIHTTGKDFIQWSIKGVIFLGPLGKMSNLYIRILENFFDTYGIGDKYDVNTPVTFREDETVYRLYPTELLIDDPDVDMHTVNFVINGQADPDTWIQSFDEEAVTYGNTQIGHTYSVPVFNWGDVAARKGRPNAVGDLASSDTLIAQVIPPTPVP